MPACFLLHSLRRATLLLWSHIFSFWDRNLLLYKGSKRASTKLEYSGLLLCYFWTPCSYEEKFFSERRSRELLGHNGEGMKQDWSTVGKKIFAEFFMLRSFWINICACRSSQINHLVLTSSFLTPYLDKMYNNQHEGGQEMADVLVSCCHASYPFKKCGIIVSEILLWDCWLEIFNLAILPLWHSQFWRMSICIVTMALSWWFFLQGSVTQAAWTFFSAFAPMKHNDSIADAALWDLSCDS